MIQRTPHGFILYHELNKNKNRVRIAWVRLFKTPPVQVEPAYANSFPSYCLIFIMFQNEPQHTKSTRIVKNDEILVVTDVGGS